MHESLQLLVANLVSPLPLAFLIGIAATLLRSELEFPQPVLNAISIYLVFAIALKGGTEIAAAGFTAIAWPVLVTAGLACAVPCGVFMLARRWLRLSTPDAAGLAALYGSVSSVTFFAALTYAARAQTTVEPFMPVLVSVMEWGILVALFLARRQLRRETPGADVPVSEIVVDTLRSRSVVLMLGGLGMGWAIGESGFKSVKLVFEDAFRGVLVLFLLEMGMVAARKLRELRAVGPRLILFAFGMPLVHGVVGVLAGKLAGLSHGGAFVLGAITASASYIDAPAAVRAALPQANPSIYLTSSLGLTFPFNLLVGLPLLHAFAARLY
jgi:hypothetical protein